MGALFLFVKVDTHGSVVAREPGAVARTDSTGWLGVVHIGWELHILVGSCFASAVELARIYILCYCIAIGPETGFTRPTM